MKDQRRCRQKKRWEDNIKEWTGMDFASSTRAAENRSWRKAIVAKWCPTTFKCYAMERLEQKTKHVLVSGRTYVKTNNL